MKTIKSWGISFAIASVLFFAVRPMLVQALTLEEQLTQLLAGGNVTVESEIGRNGYRQVYYNIGGNKAFVTESNHVNADPMIDGEQMVWMSQINGRWQIFLHHIPTNQTTQLTLSGNNVNPKIDGGNVVWEGWLNDSWQVFFFDVKSVNQLTSGDPSLNVDITGDYVVFARRDINRQWRSVVYSIEKNETKEISVGNKSKNPKIDMSGRIILSDEEFPLTVDDLFLLDLEPLASTPSPEPELIVPETVTEEEIKQELTATPSAVLEATPSGQIQP